jgi:hypothetical protein
MKIGKNADVCFPTCRDSVRALRELNKKWAKTSQNGKNREKRPFLSQAVPGALAHGGTRIGKFEPSAVQTPPRLLCKEGLFFE